MEGQVFSGKQAQRFNLSGLVPDRAEALRRLRVYHVSRGASAVRVDTGTRAMEPAIEDQLQSALARAGKLESDLAASAALTEEESKKVTALTAQVETLTAEIAGLHDARTQFESDLATAKQTVASLTTRNAELEGVERDFRKSVAIEVARVASQFGSSTPGKVTPQGDTPAAVSGASTSELIARYTELVAARQPQEAARFYQEHIAPLLPTR
jgi:septal ring factor EnvC (AmiA/AmiB activator)